ncbi:MAG TPA: aminoglycoside adenylyltransferase domain-containing protein [Gemmatimonadaceae bacterium]
MQSLEQPTPYAELNAVLRELVASIRQAIGNDFIGAYLQGSFAVGDFDEHSDADFVVVIRNALSDAQVAELQRVHERIYGLESEWARHLEGSYFPAAILRSGERCGEPLWYLDHGSNRLIKSDHCNTLVVRSVVRERGITLAGPDPTTLVDPISVMGLRSEMSNTMRAWAKEIFEQQERYRNRFYQGYIVLSYSRMLHDLVEGRPGSKREGAAWAKATLGTEWAALIDRAWTRRPNPVVAVREPADPVDFEATLRFVEMVLREGEKQGPT